MAGFESIAAILGVADVTFRSISSIYNLVQDQKQAPKEIEALRKEIRILQGSLVRLESLDGADATIRATVKSIGLPEAITACGQSCEALERHLPKLILSRRVDFWARTRFVFHKREIQSVLNDINTAKITTILTLEVINL
jgi:hypothetical protein